MLIKPHKVNANHLWISHESSLRERILQVAWLLKEQRILLDLVAPWIAGILVAAVGYFNADSPQDFLAKLLFAGGIFSLIMLFVAPAIGMRWRLELLKPLEAEGLRSLEELCTTSPAVRAMMNQSMFDKDDGSAWNPIPTEYALIWAKRVSKDERRAMRQEKEATALRDLLKQRDMTTDQGEDLDQPQANNQ